MSVFFQNMAIPTGAVAVYINGKPVGWATGFNHSIDYNKEEIRGLDSALPVEIAPGSVSITGTITMVRPRNSGGLEGMGIIAPIGQLINEKYFSLALLDKSAGVVIYMSNKCSILNQKWDLQARNIVTGGFTFKALDYRNEFEAPASTVSL